MPEGIWYARRDLGPASGIVELIPVLGEVPPGPGPVEVADVPDGWLSAARLDRATGRVLSVRVAERLAPRAPAMWLVAAPEPEADPPAMVLMAFGTPDRDYGDIVPAEEFTPMPVRGDEQLAAVRWFVRTGQVREVYVDPAQRRRGIGTKLLTAAGTFALASGWPRLWGNGERTDLGEALVRGGHPVLAHRAAAWTRTLPPMTPGG